MKILTMIVIMVEKATRNTTEGNITSANIVSTDKVMNIGLTENKIHTTTITTIIGLDLGMGITNFNPLSVLNHSGKDSATEVMIDGNQSQPAGIQVRNIGIGNHHGDHFKRRGQRLDTSGTRFTVTVVSQINPSPLLTRESLLVLGHPPIRDGNKPRKYDKDLAAITGHLVTVGVLKSNIMTGVRTDHLLH